MDQTWMFLLYEGWLETNWQLWKAKCLYADEFLQITEEFSDCLILLKIIFDMVKVIKTV